MAIDLFLAALLTLSLGLPVFIWGDALPGGAVGALALVASVIVSIWAGLHVALRRLKSHIVPIASIYIVVMCGVLLAGAFLIAWYRGRVEL